MEAPGQRTSPVPRRLVPRRQRRATLHSSARTASASRPCCASSPATTKATEGTVRIDGRAGVMRQLVGLDPRRHDRARVPRGACGAAVARGRGEARRRRARGRRTSERQRHRAAVRARARRMGRRRRIRRRGVLGRLPHRGVRRRPRPGRRASGRARSPAASRSDSRSRCCCAAPTTCCSSTSPTTSSTSRRSAGSSSSCERPRRRSSTSATTASSSPATATKIVTLEASGAWTHGASFATYYEARDARRSRIDDEHTRHQRERDRLEAIMKEMKRRASFADNFAPKAKAAESRLRHFDEAGPPPERVKDQKITMRLGGARTGKRAVVARRSRARRAHRPVRRRALVRRAGRGRRAERHRQEPLPPPARRAARSAITATGASARTSSPASSARPTTIPSSPDARWSRSCRAATKPAARR